jgi:hypothetical protein
VPLQLGRRTVLLAAAATLALAAGVYLRAGAAHAYLAADDFQWLTGGLGRDWSRLLTVSARGHFYRPVIDAWFIVTTTACGPAVPCYHLANLAVHLVNIVLVLALVKTVTGNDPLALLTAALWAVQPTPSQAILWVSAVTSLLAATFYLTSLLAQAASWTATAPGRRTTLEMIAALAFALALYAHEAAATLPVVSWCMWQWFGPRPLHSRRTLLAAFGIAIALFASTTVLANRRNYVFTEAHYQLGPHIAQHAIDYLVSLFVMPRWWLAYALAAALVLAMLAAGRVTRFGAGFSLAVAGAIIGIWTWALARWPESRGAVHALLGLVAAFAVVRSAIFCGTNARREVQSFESWRTEAASLDRSAISDASGTLTVHVTPNGPVDHDDVGYVEPMMRWIRQDPNVAVTIGR